MGLVKKFKVSAFPVMDGAVVRGRDQYAIAMKKTSGNILLDKGDLHIILQKPILFLRGIISLFENGILWSKMLEYSANYFDKEEMSSSDVELLSKSEWNDKQDRIKAENSQKWLTFVGILILVLIGILSIFIVPTYVSSAFFNNVSEGSWIWFNVIECIVRLVMCVIYLAIFKASGGVFNKFRQYSSALHKTMNCFEAGDEISLENVRRASDFHPRSTLYMAFLTILIFSIGLIFIKMDNIIFAFLIRVGILIASISLSYEISRLFGMFNGKVARGLAMIFGMWIETFEVSEPDDMQLYVAITAVKNAMIEG